jgi:hypothetical protein
VTWAILRFWRNSAKPSKLENGVDAGSFSGGRALIPESLENTLVNVLWSQDEARLFQRIKKKAIQSPVHQWDKRTAVGASDGAWVPEGGSSVEADQTIARVYETAKYLQTLRKATLQATLSNMIENAMTIEQNAGALWIIREVEKAMFYGNDSFFPEQPKGILQQATTNILDVRGSTADSATSEKAINDASRQIRDAYGKGSLMLSSTMVMQDVQNLIRDRVRFNSGNETGTAVFNRYPTPFGELELLDDVFIREGAAPVASTLTSQRPGAINIDSATAAGSGSQFAAGDAGDYWYGIAGVNRYGEGPITATDAAVSVAAGEQVDFQVDCAAPLPTAYKIYRSKKGAANASDLKYMKTVGAGNGTNDTFSDTNSDLPGTSHIFILTMDDVYDAIEWFQFLPLMKFDLYPTNEAVLPVPHASLRRTRSEERRATRGNQERCSGISRLVLIAGF